MEQRENATSGAQQIKDLGCLNSLLVGATVEGAEVSEPIFEMDNGLYGYDWLSLQVRTPNGQRLSLTLTVDGETSDVPGVLVAEASYLPCAEGSDTEAALDGQGR